MATVDGLLKRIEALERERGLRAQIPPAERFEAEYGPGFMEVAFKHKRLLQKGIPIDYDQLGADLEALKFA